MPSAREISSSHQFDPLPNSKTNYFSSRNPSKAGKL